MCVFDTKGKRPKISQLKGEIVCNMRAHIKISHRPIVPSTLSKALLLFECKGGFFDADIKAPEENCRKFFA